MTADKITIEDLRKAREIMDRQKVPDNLGLVCPYCGGHIKDGALLNSSWHEDDCPVLSLDIPE